MIACIEATFLNFKKSGGKARLPSVNQSKSLSKGKNFQYFAVSILFWKSRSSMVSRKVIKLIAIIASIRIRYINAKTSIPCKMKVTSSLSYHSLLDIKHGGSTQAIDSTLGDVDYDELNEVADRNDENEVKEDPESIKRRKRLQKYRLEQQMLMQLRSTFLSEALAKRGLPMTTLLDVSTPEGSKPPEIVDWDCAMSTPEEPKVRYILLLLLILKNSTLSFIVIPDLSLFI
jgi:hypothetical protein